MQYLPFNLETALAHPEKIITRDGRKVENIHLVPDWLDSSYQVKVFFGIREIQSYTIEGKYYDSTEESNQDLFLLPEPLPYREWWMNVYVWKSIGELCVFIHNTKEEADKSKSVVGDLFTYIKTIKITNQPE